MPSAVLAYFQRRNFYEHCFSKQFVYIRDFIKT